MRIIVLKVVQSAQPVTVTLQTAVSPTVTPTHKVGLFTFVDK